MCVYTNTYPDYVCEYLSVYVNKCVVSLFVAAVIILVVVYVNAVYYICCYFFLVFTCKIHIIKFN